MLRLSGGCLLCTAYAILMHTTISVLVLQLSLYGILAANYEKIVEFLLQTTDNIASNIDY
jgi:hypothetical protein